MSQHQTSTILIILVIAVTFTAITQQQQGFAFSDRYSAQQRFSSGYQDGLNMCGDQAQVMQYKHTAEYKGHSDDYHHGFFSGSHNCQAADDVGANNGYTGDGNGNQGQSSPMHFSKITADNQNNRNQNQGQSNTQTSSCIGICYGTGPYSSQNQALGN